jgi:hypothetical protein
MRLKRAPAPVAVAPAAAPQREPAPSCPDCEGLQLAVIDVSLRSRERERELAELRESMAAALAEEQAKLSRCGELGGAAMRR